MIFTYVDSYPVEEGTRTEIKHLTFEKFQLYTNKYGERKPTDCIFLEKETEQKFKFVYDYGGDFTCTKVNGERNITYTYKKNIFGKFTNRIESFNRYSK